LKVLAVSEDRRNLDDIGKLSSGVGQITELFCHEGALAGMASLPAGVEADVLLLDCRHGGDTSLRDLERLMTFYPSLATVLVVDQETPELLLRALRLGVREVIRGPLSQEDIRAAVQHIQDRASNERRRDGKVLAFMSCKGGSGASFLATNLGYALATRASKRVLLIDLNLQFGDAVLYLSDRRPPSCLSDITRELQQIDMSLLRAALVEVTPNFGVLAAPEDPTQSVDIRPSHIEGLLRFVRSHYDYVLLDVGRSLDTCSIQALDLADQIYPVFQLTLPFLRDAKRLFDVYRSLDYSLDKVRPLLNRVERASGDLTQEDAGRLLVYKIFATIPNHYKSVAASVNQGVPIMKLDGGSPVAQCLDDLVDRITERPPVEKGVLARLFGRR